MHLAKEFYPHFLLCFISAEVLFWCSFADVASYQDARRFEGTPSIARQKLRA
jgi:hypothetical protein